MNSETEKIIAEIADSMIKKTRDTILETFYTLGENPTYGEVVNFGLSLGNELRTHIYSYISGVNHER